MTSNHGAVLRHIEEDIKISMNETNILAITGAHKCGKTTLAQKIAKEHGMKFVTLNDPKVNQQAHKDPEGFIANLAPTGAVIDEIQKAPRLSAALKFHTEENLRPSRFVITGSVNIFPLLPVSLAGIAHWIELDTFSQAEIEGLPSGNNFLTSLLNGDSPQLEKCDDLSDLWPRVLRGGYPNAVLSENSESGRQWLKKHGDLATSKYIKEHFKIKNNDKFNDFISHLAENSGSILNPYALSKKLGVKLKTIDHWIWILSNVYLISPLYNWVHPMLEGVVSQPPKIHFLDSGLLASLRGWENLDPIIHYKKRQSLLESFVYGELRKAMNSVGGFPHLYSYQHKDGAEVDFIAHNNNLIVGIDVKASPSLKPSDFEGLKHLRKQIKSSNLPYGEQLACGVIFYTGKETQCFDGELYGVPVGKLWTHARSQQQELGIREQQVGA